MSGTDRGGSVTLRCASIEVEILAAGASIRSLRIPGVPHSLVVGAADAGIYGPGNKSFLGATIGRNANRIGRARVSIEGQDYRLTANEPPNQLHGGPGGFWSRDWQIAEASETRAVFTLHSPDGDEGYPGAADVRAEFAVADDGVLSIDYSATVDRPSIVNLTSHLYVNLAGGGSTRDHWMEIDADAYLPVDDALIPSGEVRAVEGTPFDFRKPRRLGDGPALLDHNFCLAGGATATPRRVLRLFSEESGVALEIQSGEAGMQVYDGWQFDGSIVDVDGQGIGPYGAIALEPQAWPDAPHHAHFPSTLLRPGETYRHASRYRFSRERG